MDSKENKKVSENETKNERRKFLKKAVYAAPVVMILGQLTRPTKTEAFANGNEFAPSLVP